MDELKSRTTNNTACVLRLRNDRATPVLLWWLDHEGKAVAYGSVPAGASVEQSTYTGHAWRLCDETTGVPLAEYVGGTSATVTLTLRADGSVRVASAEAGAADGSAGPSVEPPGFDINLSDEVDISEQESPVGSDAKAGSDEYVFSFGDNQ